MLRKGQRDVSLSEDDCRIRKDNGPHNLAILRRIAMASIKNSMSKADDPRVKTVRSPEWPCLILKMTSVFLPTGKSRMRSP